MPGSALLVSDPHPVGASSPDGVAAAGVFVVWGDVADRFVQPDAVVVAADAFELGADVLTGRRLADARGRGADGEPVSAAGGPVFGVVWTGEEGLTAVTLCA